MRNPVQMGDADYAGFITAEAAEERGGYCAAPTKSEYIVRLVGQVVRVSVETVKVVRALPAEFEPAD